MKLFWMKVIWQLDWWRLNIWYRVRYWRTAKSDITFHEIVTKTLQEKAPEIEQSIIRNNGLFRKINAEKRGG